MALASTWAPVEFRFAQRILPIPPNRVTATTAKTTTPRMRSRIDPPACADEESALWGRVGQSSSLLRRQPHAKCHKKRSHSLLQPARDGSVLTQGLRKPGGTE